MRKIEIENFGPIKTVDIEIKDILILIGEQASGKSTISKLIYFFKSLRSDLFNIIYENSTSDIKQLQKLLFPKIREKFYNFFGSTKHLPNFKIRYHYSVTKFLELTLYDSSVSKYDKVLKPYLSPNFFGNTLKEAENLINAISDLSKKRNSYELIAIESTKLKYLKELDRLINNIFEDHCIPLFIPAGRNVTVTYSDQFKLDLYSNLKSQKDKLQSVDIHLMIEFLKRVEWIKERFYYGGFKDLIAHKIEIGGSVNENLLAIAQNKIESILKGEYQYKDYGESIVYNAETNEYIHLNNASSGQQEVIRILQDIFLVLLEQEDVFRVIEEPEAHLYPIAQKRLLEMIALLLNASHSQIIITTHSPYILSIVNNLLFASQVVEKNQLVASEVNSVIDKSMWLDPAKCQAYTLKEGYCHSILDSETELIGENYLDDISEELGADFDQLYHLYGHVLK